MAWTFSPGNVYVIALAMAACVQLREDRSAETDSGAAVDGSVEPNVPSSYDAGSGVDDKDGNTGNALAAEIQVTFGGGCSPALVDLFVVTDPPTYSTLSVVNATSPGAGTIQLYLPSGQRTLTLSSAATATTKDLIAVTAGGVRYTNLCKHEGDRACSRRALPDGGATWDDDPIGGIVEIFEWAPEDGKLAMKLTNVTLQSLATGALCRMNGTVRTTRLGR